MKNVIIILFFIGMVGGYSFGQRHKFLDPPEGAQRKIEELEKIKLMEILNLKDDIMLKFFSRRKDFLDKIRQLEMQKNDKVDQLEKAINEENDQALKKRIDEIGMMEQSLMKAKNDFIISLNDILNQQEIAKVIIFERNFRRELRDLIIKHRKRDPNSD
ncbi:MAG: hypothetical protein NTX22_00440 [Ignavibacteriales bacterium]|nr:hypothetical protein [Ignavibacteriales bacterium]